MKITHALAIGLLVHVPPILANTEGDVAAGHAISSRCANCHGVDGNPADIALPRLAGQEPEYLKKQLWDFQTGHRSKCGFTRTDVKVLSGTDIADIATYFATQTPKRTNQRQASALGERIYTRGTQAGGFVPACIGCHGPAGGGRSHWQQVMKTPPSILPASIGGQPVRYLTSQLLAFKAGTRSNDEGAVMRNLARNMTSDEIESVAIYIGGLR